MRAHWLGKWAFFCGITLLMAACRTAPFPSVSSTAAPLTPLTTFEVKSVSDAAPTPMKPASGVQLLANIDGECAKIAQPQTACIKPYVGEFVITELNGAEVTRMRTDQQGHASIDLPPGKYILGVKTENIYPLAAPVKVNVLAERYVQISLTLDSGQRGQLGK